MQAKPFINTPEVVSKCAVCYAKNTCEQPELEQPLPYVLTGELRLSSLCFAVGVIDRPDFDQGLSSLGPITESNFGATDIGGGKQLGGGDYRLLLLDSENHSEQLVVSVITTVVPSTDEQHAKNCFQTSKQLGQALVTSALKEHAEFYCDQMLRKGCKASIEPDTTTL